MQLIIDPEFKALMPPLDAEVRRQLEQNILIDRGVRNRLVVWAGHNILLDGHNRYQIAQDHNLPFQIEAIELKDREAVKDWIISHQLGRRNLTPEQTSYYRGLQYEREKGKREDNLKQNQPKGQNDPSEDVAEKLAQQHKVGEKTIKRDAQFARAVDTVAKAAGDAAKTTLLSRDTKVAKQDTVRLGAIAEASPQTAKNVLKEVQRASTPKQASQVIREAHRQLPSPPPKQPMPASVAVVGSAVQLEISAPTPKPKEAPHLVLLPDPPKDWDEEIVLDDGKKLYVLHRPTAKPVFNQTNDSVDWADWTWNPVTGCLHGCNYCYAREIANSERMAKSYPYKFEPTFHPSRLAAPRHTAVPKDVTDPRAKNVFTCSMADLFGRWVPESWILQVFEAVAIAPQWNFLFLTKFPQRLQEINDALGGFPSNAWVGTTVDTQARVRVAEKAFANIQAKVKWLSCEPLLERLTFTSLDMFDWVVIGGQSASYFNGTPALQPKWDWVEYLWEQSRISGCKIYWKENLVIRPKECPW